MLAIVGAVAAYWGVKIVTPAPASAPPPLGSPPPREPDQVLAARMFGLVQASQANLVANVQVVGVVAAGSDSAAVLIVDGKPARAYLVGQEIAPGTSLESVTAEAATLSGRSGKQELRLPPRPTASFGGASPPPAFTLSGNTLSAESVVPGAVARPIAPAQQAPDSSSVFNPQAQPPQTVPQVQPAQQAQPPQPAAPLRGPPRAGVPGATSDGAQSQPQQPGQPPQSGQAPAVAPPSSR